MRKLIDVSIIVGLLAVASAEAGLVEVDLQFSTGPQQYTLLSRAEVFYTDALGNPAVTDLTIVHWIWDSNYLTVASSGAIRERAAAYLNYQAAGGQVGKCYRSRAAGVGV